MTWLATARRIVDRHQFEMVDPDSGESVEYVWVQNPDGWEPVEEIKPKRGAGIVFDAFSAGVMVQIHDALKEDNRDRFAAMPFYQAHDTAMKILAKQRG